ncbi:MAG TPA: SIMPL domain-containing protein [Flavisolibacter sp.]|nr:SIMPL domain-containing protein [Flavisolibacter sp.]
MKKVTITLLMLFSLVYVNAQNEKNLFPRTITVTGSAEMDIIPDEIYVQVDLKEYDKKGQGKVSIDRIKQEFLRSVKSLGIPDSLVSIAAFDGLNSNPWWRKKHKKDELYASISYQVKVNNSNQLDQLVDILDDNATENFFIQRTATSRMDELRKKLKIDAIKAAKEKAVYLSEAINEKTGVAVTINEPVEYYTPYVYNMKASNMQLNDQAPQDSSPVSFKKIKMKYDVTVVFALL